MKIIIYCLLYLIALSGCKFPKAISASFSKQVCSCIFVVEQNENYCIDYANNIVDVTNYTIDRINKTVQSKKFGIESNATYISKKLGCSLIN